MLHLLSFTLLLLIAVTSAEDSLQGALDAIYRRERDLGHQGYDNYGNWNGEAFDLATKYENRKAELERALFDYLDHQEDYLDQEEPNLPPSPFRERAEKSKSLIHSKPKLMTSYRSPKTDNDFAELLNKYQKYADYEEAGPGPGPQMYKRYNDYNYNSLGYNSIGLRKRTYPRNGLYVDDFPQYAYKPRDRRVPFYPVTKRFPVKRSSDNIAADSNLKPKHTDPTVEKELSQLFSSNKSKRSQKKVEPMEDKTKTMKKPTVTTEKPKKEATKPTLTNSTTTDINHEHTIDHDQDKPLQMKKKSIKWSDYFGLDRRKKSMPMDNEWLLDRYHKAADITKKSTEYPLNLHKNFQKSEEKLDEKLKDIEESILDDTLKFTGAHDDVDSKEMQAVKDSIISRLATAYNVEKMRKALSEYRQSLEVRRNDWEATNDDINEEKRVAVPRKQAVDLDHGKGDGAEDNRIKCTETDENCSEQTFMAPRELMEQATFEKGGCERIERACKEVSVVMGAYSNIFETACNMHQMCMLCSDNSWFSPTRQCNILFLSKADQLCDGTMNCKRAFRESINYLEHVNRNMRSDLESACHLECPDKR